MAESTGIKVSKEMPFEHFMDMLKEKGIKSAGGDVTVETLIEKVTYEDLRGY